MSLNLFTTVFLIICVPATVFGQVQFADDNIEITEILTIGDDESAPGNYLFARPNWVAADQEGRIYVSDRTSMSIRVFDSDGVFLKEIGKRGAAPGEFQALTSLHVTPSGELFVHDGRQARLTYYSADWQIGFTKSIPTAELLWPKRLLKARQENGEELLGFLAKMPSHVSRSDTDADLLIHLYTPDVREKLEAFGSYSRIFREYDSALLRSFAASHPGDVVVRASGMLCYSPGLYFGKIYCFDSEWNAEPTELIGTTGKSKPAVKVDCDASGRKAGYIEITRIKPKPKLCGYIQSQSAGLFEVGEHLVHFTYSSEEDVSYLEYEVFGPGGELSAAGRFAEPLYRSWHSQPLFLFSDRDMDGFLYAIDMTGSAPVIRKMELRLVL